MRKEQVSIRGAREGADRRILLRANTATYFHYVGTCAMGKDASAPVDEYCACAALKLRVADASVMPAMPCCNTHAPTLSLAERAAEIVLASAPVAEATPTAR